MKRSYIVVPLVRQKWVHQALFHHRHGSKSPYIDYNKCKPELNNPGFVASPRRTLKPSEMDDGIPFIPIEIIKIILERLPVKSLIQFQCVCNLWKNLIKSPYFVASHLVHSNQENPSLIFEQLCTNDYLTLYCLDRDMQLRRVQNDPLIDSIKRCWIAGACNGLLCVRISLPGTSQSLYLWNPAIRVIIQVPESKTIKDSLYICNLGFGFSPIVNDYKIVVMCWTENDVGTVVVVYSLATDSWKNIETGWYKGMLVKGTHPTAHNGCLFWLARKSGLDIHGQRYAKVILSFDITMDEFRLIPLPPICNRENEYDRHELTVYENKLGFFSYSEARNATIDLWVIEEGIGASWSKVFTCGPFSYFADPLTIWRNQIVYGADDVCNEHSVEGKDASGIYLLDPTCNEVKVFSASIYGYRHEVFSYVESLVLNGNIYPGKH